ncbi:MAG: outer membrane beta-barrel protein [Verrucomicrobia bacterium]|nr:outer membrane beta-barrel protein [Verrucomicrobiota bacterium]
MKVNKWTMGLAALGLVSIPATSSAEEGKANGLLTALSSTTISGYVNTSIHWNTGTGNESLPAHGYNTQQKADGFNLDVFKLQIEKPLDEAQWSAGYKAELLFGGDAGVYGTTLDQNGDGSAAAVKQAYVSLRAPVGNGLDFKVGVFDTVIGYEVFDAGNNPNYTRSYGFTIEPTTHTGVLASYQVSSAVSLSAGIGNTIGPVINQKANPPKAESYKTYMGSVAVTAPEDWGFISGSTLYAGIVNGYNTGADWDQTSYYIGATLNTPVKNLKVGAALDYLSLTDSTVGNNEEEDATAWSLYASFQATEKLSLHLRGEYAETDTALLGTGTGLTGGNSKIIALTSTLQYDLWNNVLSRLEIRWDHQAGDGDMSGWGNNTAGGGGAGTPATYTKRNNVLIAANIIYKF